jgi:hypothetical protein
MTNLNTREFWYNNILDFVFTFNITIQNNKLKVLKKLLSDMKLCKKVSKSFVKIYAENCYEKVNESD